MNFQNFFYEYFLKPKPGYNPVNTTTYALLLVITFYLLYKLFKKLKIEINSETVLAILPFILIGIFTRVFEDADLISGIYFKSPIIWFLFIGLTTIIFVFSVGLQRKFNIPYYKIMFIIGFICWAPMLGFIKFNNLLGILYVIIGLIPVFLILFFMQWSIENKIVTFLQMYDAIVTFVTIQFFGYYEVHWIPSSVINLTGTPFSFVLLKSIVVISVLLLIDKFTDDEKFKKYIKIIIGLLGFITGTRDAIRLFWLV